MDQEDPRPHHECLVSQIVSSSVAPSGVVHRTRAQSSQRSPASSRGVRRHTVAYLYFCPCFEYARGSHSSQEAKSSTLSDKRHKKETWRKRCLKNTRIYES